MQGRPCTAGHQDVDRTPLEKSIRMIEDIDKWKRYVHGVANPLIKDGQTTEDNCWKMLAENYYTKLLNHTQDHHPACRLGNKTYVSFLSIHSMCINR